MTGNITDARRAASADLPTLSNSGSTRWVYRVGDTVYKVGLDSEGDEANIVEHETAQSLRNTAPDWIYVPDTSLYYVDDVPVIAMPFINGMETGECLNKAFDPELDCECNNQCLPEHIQGVIQDLAFDAVSHGNVILMEDGRYALIDLG